MVVCPDPTTPNGKCVRCGATDPAAWYGKKGAKYCKTHYDADQKAKRKATGSPGTSAGGAKQRRVDTELPPLTIDAFGEAASVVKIFSIVDERTVGRRSNPSTCARPRLSPLARPSSPRTSLVRLCVRRGARSQFDEERLERWERRNADPQRVLDHQFLVHCEVQENEKDEEGEKTLLWLNVTEMFAVHGMDRDTFDEMFQNFHDERDQRRNEALGGYEE